MIGQEVMEISDIRVKILNLNSKIKAIAAITIDGCFVVHDLKVIQGADNLFVAMPGRKTADGKYRSLCGQDEEGFNKVMEQAGNFKKYNG